MPFSYGYNPNSNSTWISSQEDMASPGWSLDSVETPAARFEEDGVCAWTQIGDPVARAGGSFTTHPSIAGNQDAGFLASSPWKNTLFDAAKASKEDPVVSGGPSYYSSEIPLQPSQPPFLRHSYSDFATDSDWASPNVDLWHTGDAGYFEHSHLADASPANMSPLSRQSSNDFSSLESPSYRNVFNEEPAHYYETPLSEARSSLQSHLESIDQESDVATSVSAHQHQQRRRRSVRKGRRHSAAGLSATPSGSRRSSVTDKKLVCPLCNKVFQRDLARHLRTHESTARFICPFPRDQCSHKRGQFNRGYDFKKHLLHYHFTFSDAGTARKLRDLNGKLSFQGRCCCGDEHEFDAEEWLDDHITCEPPRCPLLKGRTKEVVLQEAIQRAAHEEKNGRR